MFGNYFFLGIDVRKINRGGEGENIIRYHAQIMKIFFNITEYCKNEAILVNFCGYVILQKCKKKGKDRYNTVT